MPARRIIIFAALLCASAAAAPTPADAPRQVLLHLPGIAGPGRADESFVNGLRQARLDLTIEIYDWTGGDPGLGALGDVRRNRAAAARLAERITAMVRDDPRVRIHLAGHSGGGGVAVWTLEALPEDVAVQSLLLLAPALSPEYDLSPALRRVSGRAWHFHTPFDLILGPGTRAFGTIDRRHTDAAGRVGFVMPEQANPHQYDKLTQMPYDPQWMALDNEGGHLGMLRARFVREVIAPLLREQGVPDRQEATDE